MNKNLIVLSSVITLSLLSGFGFVAKEVLPNNNSSVTLEKIPELKFPQAGEVTAHELNINVDENKLPSLPKTVDTFKFKNENVNEEKVKDIGNKFGMNGLVEFNSGINSFFIKDKTSNEYLEVEKESGKLLYHGPHYSLQEIDGKLKNIPSDDEAIKRATDFLTQLDLLPANFQVAGVTENTVHAAPLNPETDKGIVVSKSVHFYQKIEGKPVLGVSRIIVGIGNNGEIDVVRKYHKSYEKVAPYPLKSSSEAVKELKEGKDLHTVIEGGQDPVIDNTEIGYYEDPGTNLEQPYLHPIYIFKGKYKHNGTDKPFEAIVPAIENEFIKKKVNEGPVNHDVKY